MSWADNIPEVGVVCKHNESGDLYLIKSKDIIGDGINKFIFYDDGLCIWEADLTPLTPQQWWDFAPWVPVESGKNPRIDESFLAKDKSGMIQVPRWRMGCFRNEENKMIDFIAWLPLPENKG